MESNNGKRRVLVVGGKDHNVPAWAEVAFEIDLIHGDYQGGSRKIAPQKADAVVIDIDHVSHNFSEQARELAREWGVPWFGVRGGWSSAVQRAAEQGTDWFVDAVQAGGRLLAEKNPPRAAEAAEIVDNAWKAAADFERDKNKAIERRLRKEIERANRADSRAEKLRSGAEQRIIGEIRRRAAEVRTAELGKLAPLRKAAAELLRTVRNAKTTMDTALQDVERARADLHRLLDAEESAGVESRP